MAEKPMDVTKPGKSKPDSTTRPVIVGHKPLMKQDPMVNSEKDDNKDVALGETSKVVHTAKVLEPPKPTKEATKEEIAPPEAVPEAEVSKTKDSPVSDESAIVDAVAEQASSKKKKDGDQTEEDKKKKEELEKLIEEKKYFIPIKVASRKRNARSAVVLLVLLVLVAGAYLVADAGLINIGINPPLDLIK